MQPSLVQNLFVICGYSKITQLPFSAEKGKLRFSLSADRVGIHRIGNGLAGGRVFYRNIAMRFLAAEFLIQHCGKAQRYRRQLLRKTAALCMMDSMITENGVTFKKLFA